MDKAWYSPGSKAGDRNLKLTPGENKTILIDHLIGPAVTVLLLL